MRHGMSCVCVACVLGCGSLYVTHDVSVCGRYMFLRAWFWLYDVVMYGASVIIGVVMRVVGVSARVCVFVHLCFLHTCMWYVPG